MSFITFKNSNKTINLEQVDYIRYFKDKEFDECKEHFHIVFESRNNIQVYEKFDKVAVHQLLSTIAHHKRFVLLDNQTFVRSDKIESVEIIPFGVGYRLKAVVNDRNLTSLIDCYSREDAQSQLEEFNRQLQTWSYPTNEC